LPTRGVSSRVGFSHCDQIFNLINCLFEQLDKEGLVGSLIFGKKLLHAVEVGLPFELDRAQALEPLREIVTMELSLHSLNLAEPQICKVFTFFMPVRVEEVGGLDGEVLLLPAIFDEERIPQCLLVAHAQLRGLHTMFA